MDNGRKLVCKNCGSTFPEWRGIQKCPYCEGYLEIHYNYASLKDTTFPLTDRNNIWRYRPLLPISNREFVSLGEGLTPLTKANMLMKKWNIKGELFIKNESVNPTGSFLDRGSSVAVSRFLGSSNGTLVCGTKGNLGASVAAYTANSGIPCELIVPKHLEIEKLYQMALFGAKIRLVDSYQKAIERVSRSPSPFTLTVKNHYFLEGLKTTAFEIFEQLGNVPDNIIVGVGTGSHISMVWKGFRELKKLGKIESLPSLYGVQTKKINPLVRATRSSTSKVHEVKEEDTIAKDLAFPDPPHGRRALNAITESGGEFTSVSDEEILVAIEKLAKTEGILSEPAGAVAVAGGKKLLEQRKINPDSCTVLLVTGAGLKDHTTIQTLVKQIEVHGKLTDLMKGNRVVSRIGKTKRLILRILSEGKNYGYGIREILKQKYETSVSLPTVYQHLKDLTEYGLITKIKSENSRKYYLLVEKGEKYLKKPT